MSDEKREWVCKDCGKVYTAIQSYYNHCRDNHIDAGNWTCDLCGKEDFDNCSQLVNKIFKTKSRLEFHIKKVHCKRPCDICGKLFGEKQLKKHVLQVHTENDKKPYICSVCNKGFVTSYRLKNHMNTHTGNKPYICQHCGKGFADHRNMKAHVKAHNGYKRKQRNRGNPEKTDYIQSENLQLI